MTLLVGFSLGFMSCGGDDDDPQPSTDPKALIGSWNAVSRQLTDCPDAADEGILNCGTYDFCFKITFLSETTYTEQPSGGTEGPVQQFAATDGVMSICLDYKGCENWIYTVTGDQLKLQQVKSSDCSEILLFDRVK